MKMRVERKLLIILSMVLMMAMASWAYADDAMHPEAHGTGHGFHHGSMMYGHRGCTMDRMGCMGAISRQDIFKDTLVLRQDIKSKMLAVESELVKASPDAHRAMTLQKELSALKAQMAQKRLACLLEIKRIAPAANIGCLAGCRRHMKMGMNEGPMGHHRHGMMNDDNDD